MRRLLCCMVSNACRASSPSTYYLPASPNTRCSFWVAMSVSSLGSGPSARVASFPCALGAHPQRLPGGRTLRTLRPPGLMRKGKPPLRFIGLKRNAFRKIFFSNFIYSLDFLFLLCQGKRKIKNRFLAVRISLYLFVLLCQDKRTINIK